jgi:selenocysteine lyase/cysteine desulfurase
MRLLAGRFREELAAAGVHMLTNAEPERRAGVVKFRIRGRNTREIYDTLWKRHRLAAAHTASGDAEGIRFSPHVYNTMDDVRQAVAAVRSLAG